MPSISLRLVAMLALALALAACGKRPGFVDSPLGRPNDRFPHQYPDPSTDPKPGTNPGPSFP